MKNKNQKKRQKGICFMVMYLGVTGAWILILLFKLLKGKKTEEKQRMILSSMAEIYGNLYLVDLEKNLVSAYMSKKEPKEIVSCSKNTKQVLQKLLIEKVEEEYTDEMMQFTNLNNLAQRMAGKKKISQEYIEKNQGWMQASFLVAAKNKNTMPVKVVFVTQSIDKQKRKEAKLISESNTDELTGCFNRRAYEEEIRMLDAEEMFWYVLVDVNGLKDVNDTLGHGAGDELIRGTAFCMKQSFEKYGKVYRIGGDEFVAVMAKKEEDIMEIKVKFAEQITEWKGNLARSLSVSCGYVFSQERKWNSVLEIAKAADERMYQDKAVYYEQKGRDRRRER